MAQAVNISRPSIIRMCPELSGPVSGQAAGKGGGVLVSRWHAATLGGAGM